MNFSAISQLASSFSFVGSRALAVAWIDDKILSKKIASILFVSEDATEVRLVTLFPDDFKTPR